MDVVRLLVGAGCNIDAEDKCVSNFFSAKLLCGHMATKCPPPCGLWAVLGVARVCQQLSVTPTKPM